MSEHRGPIPDAAPETEGPSAAMFDGEVEGAPSDNTSLTRVLQGYREAGFTGDFYAVEGGRIRCGHCGFEFPALGMAMHSLRRLEGASDPADMLAVVAASCPECGTKGVLVLGYGPMASAADADVLLAIQDLRADDLLPGSASPSDRAPSTGAGAPASPSPPGGAGDLGPADATPGPADHLPADETPTSESATGGGAPSG